ncbi:MAG: bacteriophage abortive infection AbiH family protein [Mollicutes bacterium PWAP]|nr:bacteriophage abortive infection AbiH family protein [Mollicutes bacterium PWAP]
MKKIIILGNGYDLNNRLKTKYSDYYNFLEKNKKYKNLFNTIQNLFPINEKKWSDLENELANHFDNFFSDEKINEKVKILLKKGLIEKTNDYVSEWKYENAIVYKYNENKYKEILDLVFKNEIKYWELINSIVAWIKQTQLNAKQVVFNNKLSSFNLKDKDLIINFNFTTYLLKTICREKLFFPHYNVEEKNLNWNYLGGDFKDFFVLFGSNRDVRNVGKTFFISERKEIGGSDNLQQFMHYDIFNNKHDLTYFEEKIKKFNSEEVELFFFGFSFGDQDKNKTLSLFKNIRIKTLYVSLYNESDIKNFTKTILEIPRDIENSKIKIYYENIENIEKYFSFFLEKISLDFIKY